MGVVVCRSHGKQAGVLCCEHIEDAAAGAPQAPVDPDAIVPVTVDLVDDRSVMVDVILCAPCATASHRAAGEVLAGAAFEDEAALPWVGLVCPRCLERWTGRPLAELLPRRAG
jgi:hypothetical protein